MMNKESGNVTGNNHGDHNSPFDTIDSSTFFRPEEVHFDDISGGISFKAKDSSSPTMAKDVKHSTNFATARRNGQFINIIIYSFELNCIK